MALLAVWVDALSAWAAAPEVVVMSPVPGRTRPEFDNVIGCLVQSLLLRVDATGAPGLGELLDRVRATVLDAAEHQYYPYEEFSRAIPYPAWFRFESWGGAPGIPGLESEPFELPRELMFDWPLPPGETDLSAPELALTEQPDGALTGWLVYNHRSFERTGIERLAGLFLARLGYHLEEFRASSTSSQP
jgi:non-ribosomal peptide synthetase component F